MKRHPFLTSLAPLILVPVTVTSSLVGLSQRVLAQSAESSPLLQVEGVLEPGDEVVSSDGSLYDTYTFEGEAGQTVSIVMESLEFDPYLWLLDPQGQSIEQNDDYDETTFNSAIVITLPQDGIYTIRANAYDAINQGQYTLVVQPVSSEQQTPVFSEVAIRQAEALRIYRQAIQQYNASQFQEALQSLEQGLEIYREIGDRRGEGETLTAIGLMYDYLGEYEQAIDRYEQSLVIRQEIGDRQGAGVTLNNIGEIHRALGEYEQALDYYQQNLELFREIGYRRGEGTTLNNIGGVYDALAQYDQALDYYQQSLVIRQEVDDRRGEGVTLNNIGAVYDYRDEYEQALDFYHQSLEIRREIGDRRAESSTLSNIGGVYENLGQYEQALDFYQQSIAISQEIGDRIGEGSALNNIGEVYVAIGQYGQALDYSEQSLAIFQEMSDRQGEGVALNKIGEVYRKLSRYGQALDYYEQSLTISREFGDLRSEGITLNNIGGVHHNLGQYEQALDYYEQSLTIRQDIGGRQGEGITLNNIGGVYDALDEYEQSLNYYQQSLTIIRDIGDRAGEGTALSNIGLVYRNLGQYEQALDNLQQSLFIKQEIGDRNGEAITLNNIGLVYRAEGQHEQAFNTYQQGLALIKEVGDRANEGLFLSNIGRLLSEQNQPELAIVFFKESVNVRESIRDDIRGLDQEQQESFTETIADDYRELADLLLQADRVLEAQEVLDLLKLQELQDYELPEVRGTDDTRQGLDFWPAEQAILDRFYAALEADASLDFDTFITSPEIVAHVEQLQRNARGQNLNPEQLARLQDNLQQAGNAALLYPLILDDRLELVLVTTEGLVRETVAVDRVKLNEAIVDFRSVLTNRLRDPVPQAQQLYQWLIAPIADELEQAEANVILYAADGQLRYIPLAALHTGEQYLTQRYTINHITAASLTDFSQSESNALSILAGAFPETRMTVDLGTEEVSFSGLPFAQEEVRNIASAIPNTVAFFSEAFNRQAIEPELNNHRIVHLATHAEFRSGHPTDSFILLGDGDRITLFDLDKWELPDVDLVVLSACKTAVSAADLGNGEEILGFGYQIQRTGADAAIASLWYVNDGGTQTLMDAFYAAMQNGYSETEALRRAQMSLITGDETVLTGVIGEETDYEITDARTGQPLSQSSDLSHPYYWAPFILIGNGL